MPSYIMPGVLSDAELEIAKKALRLPDDDVPLTTDQYRDWCLIRDTWLENWLEHRGSYEQQHGYRPEPVVQTKKVISMAKYRR